MTKQLREQLTARMEDCLARNDHVGYQRALVDVQIAQMECQEHTAARVKAIERRFSSFAFQVKGARMTLRILGWIVSALGGGTALALIQRLAG